MGGYEKAEKDIFGPRWGRLVVYLGVRGNAMSAAWGWVGAQKGVEGDSTAPGQKKRIRKNMERNRGPTLKALGKSKKSRGGES